MHIVIHDYGGYSFSLQLASHLIKKNSKVTYIHGGSTQALQRFSVNGSKPDRLSLDGIQLSAPFAKYSFVRRWGQEREYGRKLAARIRQSRPGVIVSANAPLDVQQAALSASREIGTRFVFWWQDVVSLAMQAHLMEKYSLVGWLIGACYQRLECRLLQNSDHILAISEDFLSIAKEWGIARERISVFPNWAPLEDLPLLSKDNPWARSRGLDDKFVFLYSGILGLKHTPQTFLDLVTEFSDDPQVRVVVVSEGPGMAWLEAQKQARGLDNLVLLPFQPYGDYAAMLASADVLLAILNTKAGEYSVPSKVLSYLCAGRLVLLQAPAHNQAARMLAAHEIGLVAEPGETETLLSLAHSLRSDPALTEKLGRNARLYAEQHFKIEDIAQRFKRCLPFSS